MNRIFEHLLAFGTQPVIIIATIWLMFSGIFIFFLKRRGRKKSALVAAPILGAFASIIPIYVLASSTYMLSEWKHIGACITTDLDGNSLDVIVSIKECHEDLSPRPYPPYPQKVNISSTRVGRTTNYTFVSSIRTRITSIYAIHGGIELFHAHVPEPVVYQMKNDEWTKCNWMRQHGKYFHRRSDAIDLEGNAFLQMLWGYQQDPNGEPIASSETVINAIVFRPVNRGDLVVRTGYDGSHIEYSIRRGCRRHYTWTWDRVLNALHIEGREYNLEKGNFFLIRPLFNNEFCIAVKQSVEHKTFLEYSDKADNELVERVLSEFRKMFPGESEIANMRQAQQK